MNPGMIVGHTEGGGSRGWSMGLGRLTPPNAAAARTSGGSVNLPPFPCTQAFTAIRCKGCRRTFLVGQMVLDRRDGFRHADCPAPSVVTSEREMA